jgi:hypothetical protein
MKEIWEALKALLPLFGPSGDGLIVGSSFKQTILRYFSALTLLSVVIWGLDKLRLAPMSVPRIVLYGFELDAKVIATVGYGVFYGIIAIAWAIVLVLASVAVRGKLDSRSAISLAFGTITLLLTGVVACLVLFGAINWLFGSPPALQITGCLLVTLIAYSFARLALWLRGAFSLSSTVASGASSLLFLSLVVSNYLALVLLR